MDIEPDDEAENAEPVALPPITPPRRTIVPRRPLGNFMTPQVTRATDVGLAKGKGRMHGRYSVGGFTPGGIHGAEASVGGGISGPRRVRVVEPWRVTDITVPIPDEEEEAREEEYVPDAAPSPAAHSPFVSPTKRERVTEEERKVIPFHILYKMLPLINSYRLSSKGESLCSQRPTCGVARRQENVDCPCIPPCRL